MTLDRDKPFRPLSVKLLGWVLLFSMLFTVLMTAGLVVRHYFQERAEASQGLRFAADSYRRSLANSLWELDMSGARLQLEALARFPMVGVVELRTVIGQTIRVSRDGNDHAPAPGTQAWHETLLSNTQPARPVGELWVYLDQPALLARVESVGISLLVGEALKGVLLGLLIAFLLTRLITRHVSDIARHAAELDPALLDQPIHLRRRPSRSQDELDQLSHAINDLHGGLADYIRRQHELEDELRGHRDQLSQVVTARTRSLERLGKFLTLIISLLTRFINLPPERTDETVDEGMAIIGRFFGASRCLLFLREGTSQRFALCHGWPAAQRAPMVWLPADEVASHWPARHSPVVVPVSGADAQAGQVLAALSATACTLVRVDMRDHADAMLCLVGPTIAAGDADAGLLELAARVTADMLHHKAHQQKLVETQEALHQAVGELQTLSRHDELTGLPNRRHFDEVKQVEFRRAQRTDQTLAVLMCDVDDFKRYNDTYGHQLGDDCLVAIGGVLKQMFSRAGDLAARIGGEEFVVLLPNTTPEVATLQAEALRRRVWELAVPHRTSSTGDRVTLSVGIATLRTGYHADFDGLLRHADHALYLAKAAGRNCVVSADDERV